MREGYARLKKSSRNDASRENSPRAPEKSRIGDAPETGAITLAARLWGDYLSRYWPKLLVALLATALYAASASAIPIGVEWINSGFSQTSLTVPQDRFSATARDVVLWGPVIIIVLGAANAVAQFVQTRLSASAALHALRDIQNDMYASLTGLDDAQARNLGSGQAITLFTNDTLVLRETLTRVATAVRDLLTLAGLCAVMIYYDWVLFAVVLAVYPVIGWPIIRIGKYLRRRSGEVQTHAGEIAALVNESVAGGRMVKTYRLEEVERLRAGSAFEKRLSLLKGIAHLRALNEPFIFFVGSVALAIVVAVVAMRIMEGALNGAQFISFIIALLLLSQPARGLSTLNAVTQEGFGALDRILSLIDLTPTIIDQKNASPLVVKSGEVSFRNVNFSYVPGLPALNGFSLEAPPGKTIALVGESGAGKSTAFNLLPRLFDPQSGEILIDGQSISAVTLASLRENIAIVSQDTILFDDTVSANIAFGRIGAPQDQIERAASMAAADEFISDLPKGYETIVGENGANLSGGQRQRIAIARAFLKDAPILLLDEATSALDAESEAKIQDALARLAEGRTTIVIAHRLATVKSADSIMVIDHGRVVESGTHQQLLQSGGIYARLAKLQFEFAAE